ncbi:MAG: hypothetical protein WC405_17270 [Syntrophales bacterium]
MKLRKVAILAGVTAVFFLPGHAGKVLGFQDMVCGPGPAVAAGVQTCKTRETEREGVKIFCEMRSSAKNTGPVYICAAMIRDWGQPSPYAHTSFTWRCQAGPVETFLFASDFFRDSVRCDLVCGRCEAGWQAAP